MILAAWLGTLAHLGRARFVAQVDEDGCLLSICPAHWNSKTRRQGAGVWLINVMLASRCSGAPKCSDWDTPGGPTDSRENGKWMMRSENDSTVRGREDPLIQRREAIKTGQWYSTGRDAVVLLNRVLFLTLSGWLAVHRHHHGSWFHTLDISNRGGKMAQERAPLMRL